MRRKIDTEELLAHFAVLGLRPEDLAGQDRDRRIGMVICMAALKIIEQVIPVLVDPARKEPAKQMMERIFYAGEAVIRGTTEPRQSSI